jgi:hypothetical protein
MAMDRILKDELSPEEMEELRERLAESEAVIEAISEGARVISTAFHQFIFRPAFRLFVIFHFENSGDSLFVPVRRAPDINIMPVGRKQPSSTSANFRPLGTTWLRISGYLYPIEVHG